MNEDEKLDKKTNEACLGRRATRSRRRPGRKSAVRYQRVPGIGGPTLRKANERESKSPPPTGLFPFLLSSLLSFPSCPQRTRRSSTMHYSRRFCRSCSRCRSRSRLYRQRSVMVIQYTLHNELTVPHTTYDARSQLARSQTCLSSTELARWPHSPRFTSSRSNDVALRKALRRPAPCRRALQSAVKHCLDPDREQDERVRERRCRYERDAYG